MVLAASSGALVGIIAMMSTGWIIAQTHRVHHRPMVLLYLLIELIASALTFLFRGPRRLILDLSFNAGA